MAGGHARPRPVQLCTRLHGRRCLQNRAIQVPDRLREYLRVGSPAWRAPQGVSSRFEPVFRFPLPLALAGVYEAGSDQIVEKLRGPHVEILDSVPPRNLQELTMRSAFFFGQHISL